MREAAFIGGPLDGRRQAITEAMAMMRFPLPDIEPAVALRFGPEADVWPTTFIHHLYRLAASQDFGVDFGVAIYVAIYEYQGVTT